MALTAERPALTVDAVMTAAPVMAVVTVDDAETGVGLAKALVAGGCPLVEVTLRTPKALEAITAIAREVPDAVVGAGTVLTGRDYDATVAAGARFAVSPGATTALLKAAADGPTPFLPGVATPSDIMAGLEAGYTRFKFFPAEPAGGVAALKAIGGPFGDVKFCPTGGIKPETAPAYLALPNVSCVGGSWVAPADKLKAKDWAGIEALARSAAALAA